MLLFVILIELLISRWPINVSIHKTRFSCSRLSGAVSEVSHCIIVNLGQPHQTHAECWASLTSTMRQGPLTLCNVNLSEEFVSFCHFYLLIQNFTVSQAWFQSARKVLKADQALWTDLPNTYWRFKLCIKITEKL